MEITPTADCYCTDPNERLINGYISYIDDINLRFAPSIVSMWQLTKKAFIIAKMKDYRTKANLIVYATYGDRRSGYVVDHIEHLQGMIPCVR